MTSTNHWGLGILDSRDEPWYIEANDVQAVPLRPDGEPCPVAMTAEFVIGTRTYRVMNIYDPKTSSGQITLRMDPGS